MQRKRKKKPHLLAFQGANLGKLRPDASLEVLYQTPDPSGIPYQG